MNLVRKISVGSNYPDKVLHYQIDKPVRMGAEEKNVKRIEESFEQGRMVYKVYIEAEANAVLLWKKIDGVPVVVEYLINFE